MYRALVHTSLFAAAGLITAGCASSGVQPAAEPASGVVCQTGSAVLVVRNASGREVEIVESRIGSGGRVVVAIVGQGRHEVAIRNEWGYSYAAKPAGDDRVLAATSLTRTRDRSVTLERDCKER